MTGMILLNDNNTSLKVADDLGEALTQIEKLKLEIVELKQDISTLAKILKEVL